MSWSEKQISRLRKGWERGDTTAVIAEALSASGPKVTRDMVIGKARRMGLTPRPSPIKRQMEPAE